MADIDVVKGRSSNWMWWIIAAVAILLLVMFLMRGTDANDPARTPTGAPSSSTAPQHPAALAA